MTMYFEYLTRHIDSFNELVSEMFDAHCESGLYTLKFRLVHHLV